MKAESSNIKFHDNYFSSDNIKNPRLVIIMNAIQLRNQDLVNQNPMNPEIYKCPMKMDRKLKMGTLVDGTITHVETFDL